MVRLSVVLLVVLVLARGAPAQSLCSAAVKDLASPYASERALSDCAVENPALAEDLRAAQERLRQEQYRRDDDVREQQRFYDWATEPQRPYR